VPALNSALAALLQLLGALENDPIIKREISGAPTFQFDAADLDFGIYRIMNYKRGVIERFIQKDLPRSISKELAQGALAGQTQAAKELEAAKKKVLEIFDDAIDAAGTLIKYHDTKPGKEYMAALEKAKSAKGQEALEAAIYNHLYAFFGRYWQDGDFISKRRYSKRERYAIPYNGEEVTLYWANHDQYYVKTGEHFADYTWKATNGVTVHFKLTAADVEQNNPRIKKVTFSPEWKNGKPKRMATFKVIRLESYEDTLNNLELRRTPEQEDALFSTEAQGPGNLKEQYMLNYMLDVESRGSQSLLNIDAFKDPLSYTLKVKRPGSDESQDTTVDLMETFNWLIGLTVKEMSAPQRFDASFERDSEGRLRLKDWLRPVQNGRWWIRTVRGILPDDNQEALIIWRNLPGTPEEDNLILDEWFKKSDYSTKEKLPNYIYVNGTNNLENIRLPDTTWKVRLIEEDFMKLMFEEEERL